MRTRRKICRDEKLADIVALYYVFNGINLFVKNLLPMSEMVGNALTLLFAVLIIGKSFIVLTNELSRHCTYIVIAELAFFSIYISSYLMGYALQSVLLRGMIWTMGICIPLSYLVFLIEDKGILLRKFEGITYFLIVLLDIILLDVIRTGIYNMAASYALALPIIILFRKLMRNKDVIAGIIGAISTGFIVLWGARGPLLCIMAFLVLYYLFYLKNTRIKILGALIVVTIVIMIIIGWWLITSWLQKIISNNDGISMHIVEKIISGDILYDSGRGAIQDGFWNLLDGSSPIFGLGVYGGWESTGMGPHNLLIEILVALGYPLGIPLCMVVILTYLYPFILNKGPQKEILIIFCAINIPMLWVRGLGLEIPELFIYEALVISSIKSSVRKTDVLIRERGKNEIAVNEHSTSA